MRGVVAPSQPPMQMQRLVFFAGASLLAVVLTRQAASSATWTLIALAGIALAIWHGAYDTVLAERILRPRFGRRWKPLFYVAYVTLAALIVLAWVLAPAVALVAFLVYSAMHFGTEGEHGSLGLHTVSAIALGGIPIAAACHWWPTATSQIFGAMLHGQAADAPEIALVAGRLLIVLCVAALLRTRQNTGDSAARVALVVTQLILFRYCTPVVAFAVYFCMWHTPEHLIETSRNRYGRFQRGMVLDNLSRGVVPWLFSLAALGVAAWLGRHALQSYTGLVFIFLSALTVPHMVLGLLLQHGGQRVRSRRPTQTMAAGTKVWT